MSRLLPDLNSLSAIFVKTQDCESAVSSILIRPSNIFLFPKLKTHLMGKILEHFKKYNDTTSYKIKERISEVL